MLKKVFNFGLFSLLLFSLSIYALRSPTEWIQQLRAKLIINEDASIDIIENFTVKTDSDKIRHGITRYVPTHYMDLFGRVHKLNLKITRILINNQPAPFTLEKTKEGLKIYIGKPKEILPPGFYLYSLQYKVENAINFFPGKESLYWDMTGNNWDLPILKTESTVILSSSIPITEYAAMTGKIPNETHFEKKLFAHNKAWFATTKPLIRGEKFAILISWQSGFLKPPTFMGSKYPQFFNKFFENLIEDLRLGTLFYNSILKFCGFRCEI